MIEMRRRMVVRRSRRRGRVRVGAVETVYSIVVGEGRRVRRWGVVVSIALFELLQGRRRRLILLWVKGTRLTVTSPPTKRNMAKF